MTSVVAGSDATDDQFVTEQLAEEPTGQARSTLMSVLQGLVIALPLVLLGSLAWTKRNMYDDGFIYLHIVQNLMAGNGPVFNAGERVETYTGVLWVAVLWLLGTLTPFALEWVAVVTGIVMTLAAMALAAAASARLVRLVSPRSFLLPLGMLVFASVAVVWTYASTGLETGLTFLWLAACLAILAGWAGRPHRRVAWPWLVVLGLGPLVRPELALDSAVFLVILLAVGWRGDTWWGRVRLLAVALAVPVAYQLFRMGYFGALVANTAVAKEGTMPRLDQGWAYAVDFAWPYLLFVPAVALLVGAYLPSALRLRRSESGSKRLWAFLALPIAGAADAGYIVLMGGDYLHGRLLLPAFFAMLAPVAVVPLERRYLVSLIVVPWAVASALMFRTTDIWSAPFGHIRNDGKVTPDDWKWRKYNVAAEEPGGLYVKLGAFSQTKKIAEPLAPGVPSPAFATGGIGLQAYALGTDAYIFDHLGLADVLPAHLELQQRGLTAHEKNLPTPWIASALTAPGSSTAAFDSLQPLRDKVGIYTPLLPNVTGAELQRQTEWARAALKCPAIADLRTSVKEPLTFSTFFNNIAQSADRTRLRIPADPQEAYHKFCGPGTPPEVAALAAG